MKRRTKAILLIASLVIAAGAATVVTLAGALARTLDPGHNCETGFSTLVSCTYGWTSTSSGQGTPIFAPPSRPTSDTLSNHAHAFKPIYVDTTAWAVAYCPENTLARRLLCAANSSPATAAIDDSVTGLPLPKPWVLRTAKKSTTIAAIHVETLLDLKAALGFYRAELSKRAWTETSGTIVEPDRAVIAFTTANGPALLQLTRDDDRTIVDLSLRRPGTNADMLPKPGQGRLILGNTRDEEAVITINGQTIKLAAHAGSRLMDDVETARKSPDKPNVNLHLPPGKYKVALKLASGAAQKREFAVVADETWGLLAGPDGILLPVKLY